MSEIDQLTKLANACKNMEKVDCFMFDPLTAKGVELTSIMSIAISLKRIADILQGKQQPVLMSADEYKMYQDSIK